MLYQKPKFLYLTKKEWCRTWVQGGNIPINLASSYYSEDRKGIYTPDEIAQKSFSGGNSVAEQVLLSNINVHPKSTFEIKVRNVVSNGIQVGKNVHFKQFPVDGLILSFCNRFDPEIAKRLGNKKGCVAIHDIESVFHHISNQIGAKGEIGFCRYTNSIRRDHFLKSTKDEWQDEYRMFWKSNSSTNVFIPSGSAKEITIQ